MRAKVNRFENHRALLGVSLLTFLAVRIYNSQRGLPLEPWHTHVPHELSREKLDAANWTEYLAAEAGIFDDVQREVSRKLDAADRVPANRYFEGSPVYPGHFAQDFNRSFVLEPKGKPVGAVVLLHGLTDSPYSQRHIAAFYRDRGFVAIVPRMPAHGTVPAALTDVEWEDWMAATRLAVREARSRIEPSAPLHLVGFSNGGALALMYALDSLGDEKLARPDRLVLISPMVGITALARYAGLAGLAGDFSGLRQGRVARHRARVQSVQIQFVSGQRRAPILSSDARFAGADRALCPRRQTGTDCRRSSPFNR